MINNRLKQGAGSFLHLRADIFSVIRHLSSVIRNIGLWLFWFPFRRIVQAIPRSVSYAIASTGGLVISCFARDLMRITCEEVGKCLGIPPSDIRVRIAARQSFIMDVKRRFEDLILGTLTKKNMEEMVKIEGIENLNAALRKGKGVIILLSHFGSFLMILPALGFRGYKINQLGGPPLIEQFGHVHKMVFEMREKEYSALPVNFLRSDFALKDVLMALKRNELVAIAFDGRIGDNWVETEFCGNKVNVAPGPVKFAMKTGASILPTFIVRNPDNTHRLIIEKAVYVEDMKAREETVKVNLQKISNIFGEYIVKYPSHFGMILTIIRKRFEKGIVETPFFSTINN